MTSTVRAVMVVAHPDDCVIFGWPFIMRYKHMDWKILYMTYDESHPRGHEIKEFWKVQGIEVDFCGVLDNHIDLDRGKIVSFDRKNVSEKILSKLNEHEILISHGMDGEYGHPHHIFVHDVLKEVDSPRVYFSKGDLANMYIDGLLFGEQDLSKLTLHKDIIEGFKYRYDGFYLCDRRSKELLDQQ
jgi:hypothetical protein